MATVHFEHGDDSASTVVRYNTDGADVLSPATVAAAASATTMSLQQSGDYASQQRAHLRRLFAEYTRLQAETTAAEIANENIAREKLRNHYYMRQLRWLVRFHLVIVIIIFFLSLLTHHELHAAFKLLVYAPAIFFAFLTLALFKFRSWMIHLLRFFGAVNALLSLFLIVYRVLILTLGARTHQSPLWADFLFTLLQLADLMLPIMYFQTADQLAVARGRISRILAESHDGGIVVHPLFKHRQARRHNNTTTTSPSSLLLCSTPTRWYHRAWRLCKRALRVGGNSEKSPLLKTE